MKYLAYTRKTRPTGRTLAELLDFPHFGIRRARGSLRVLLRWGSRRQMPEADRVLNPARAIAAAADKVEAITRMRRAGLPTVPCFTTWPEALAASGGQILFGRTRQGMQGRGITIYDPSSLYGDLYPEHPEQEHEWYSIYHEPTREVRVHVVGSEVVRVQGKYLDFPEQAGEHHLIRNYEAGYRYRAPRQELRSRRKEIAVEAVRALGLTFGAVDILLFGTERRCMVLEVNTAPACSPLTASAYAQALTRMIER